MGNKMNIWEILEINSTDDEKTIKKAYAKLCTKYHPEEYPEKFEEIKNAYEKAIQIAKIKKQIKTNNEVNLHANNSSSNFELNTISGDMPKANEATEFSQQFQQPDTYKQSIDFAVSQGQASEFEEDFQQNKHDTTHEKTTLDFDINPNDTKKFQFDEFADINSDGDTDEQINFYENFVLYLAKMPLLDYANIYSNNANNLSFEFHGKWNTLVLSDYFYTAMIYFPKAKNRFIAYLDEIYNTNQYTHKILIENILRANVHKMPQDVQSALYACLNKKYHYSLSKWPRAKQQSNKSQAAMIILSIFFVCAFVFSGSLSNFTTTNTQPSSSEQMQELQNNAAVLSAAIIDAYQTQHGITVVVEQATPLLSTKFSYAENEHQDFYEFFVTRIYPEKQKFDYMPETVSVIIPVDYTEEDIKNYLVNDEFQHIALYFLTFELKLTNQKYNTLPADWYTWQDNKIELNYFYSAEELYSSIVLFQNEVTNNPYFTEDIVLHFVYESHADDPEFDNLRENYFPYEIIIKKDGSTNLESIEQQLQLIDAESDIASDAWLANND